MLVIAFAQSPRLRYSSARCLQRRMCSSRVIAIGGSTVIYRFVAGYKSRYCVPSCTQTNPLENDVHTQEVERDGNTVEDGREAGGVESAVQGTDRFWVSKTTNEIPKAPATAPVMISKAYCHQRIAPILLA